MKTRTNKSVQRELRKRKRGNSKQSKVLKSLTTKNDIGEKLATSKKISVDRYHLQQEKERKQQLKIISQMKNRRVSQLKAANEEEDKTIRKLEKLLGLRKKGKQKSKMFNDGLDYALELCMSESDSDEIKGSKTGELSNSVDGDLNEIEQNNSSESDGSVLDTEFLDGGQDLHLISEDIYGRKKYSERTIFNGNKESRYIPPQLRPQNFTDPKTDEKFERLRKQCKGLLNRVAESNIQKICNALESLYSKNSRNDMNSILTSLITEAFIAKVAVTERSAMEHMLLLAYLHAKVGSDLGAYFLQSLITKFHTLTENVTELDVEHKELDNIVLLLCHMHTFQMYHYSLVYEVANKLIENLCEKTVECLLILLRSSGFALRKSDPQNFKDFILTVQKKAIVGSRDITENPRLKFMLEILTAIKNNNIKKIPRYDPSLAEHLKKLLKGMILDSSQVSMLNISMEDLVNADKKGKWWVLGSAWSGNIKSPSIDHNDNKEKPEISQFNEKLLQLAKVHRMKTEDKKNIFCILMSAEDYIDAFERILRLSLKDHRLVVSISIHCCLLEKHFNPYYGALVQKFCEFDRKYQIDTQYAVWDRMHGLHSLTKEQIDNLAGLITYLLVGGRISISVLKAVDFRELSKPTLRLLRKIILPLLLGNETTCREVFIAAAKLQKNNNEKITFQIFQRIAPSTKLSAFKDRLRLFLNHFLKLEWSKSHLSAEEECLLKIRIKMADNTLENNSLMVTF